MQRKIVVAITGASGSLYAKRLLSKLKNYAELKVAVVLSKNALDVWQQELNEAFETEAQVFDRNDFRAPFASGSANYDSMVIIPCSMGTLGRIAHGISDDLISRAADVILKERRKLICVVRDTPYSMIHLENMLHITKAGGMIMPASPSFYSRPSDFDSLIDTVVDRIIDQLGLKQEVFRWGESEKPKY